MKAILLDDHGLVAESLVLNINLSDPGMEVSVCSTTSEARALLARSRYDFLFLDIDLREGERNGITFLQELKDRGSEIRVIMLSGTDDPETVLKAISLGAVGFISKASRDKSAFRTAIEVVLAKGVYLPPNLLNAHTCPPPSALAPHKPSSIAEVSQDELGVTARQYEALYHLSNGLQYKSIATKMNIEETSADELLRNAYAKLNVKGQLGFMVMLNKNGWHLRLPGVST